MSTYSNIDIAVLKGIFLAAYEPNLAGQWARKVALNTAMQAEKITYAAISAVPSVREWVGARQPQKPLASTYVATGKVYEDSVAINIESYRRSPEI